MLSRFFSVQRILINLVFDLTASQVAFEHAQSFLEELGSMASADIHLRAQYMDTFWQWTFALVIVF